MFNFLIDTIIVKKKYEIFFYFLCIIILGFFFELLLLVGRNQYKRRYKVMDTWPKYLNYKTITPTSNRNDSRSESQESEDCSFEMEFGEGW
jgi:hypothetical protein